MKKILIIAGSDSGAGAGIQADLKSAAAQGVYASTAITSITAQNTLGVQAVYHLPDDIIKQQISSVLSDIGASVIKTGMLANERIIKVVARALSEFIKPSLRVGTKQSILTGDTPALMNCFIADAPRNDDYSNCQLLTNSPLLICDPVMVAKGGHKLLDDNTADVLKNLMISKGYLVTPNIPEAEVLSGVTIKNEDDMIAAGEEIIAETGCNAVLVKGGHLKGDLLTDVLIQKGESSELASQNLITKFTSPRINTKNTHGTGCSYASAIAANLAKGQLLEDAVKNAHTYIHEAIKNAVPIGSGHSPISHFYK